MIFVFTIPQNFKPLWFVYLYCIDLRNFNLPLPWYKCNMRFATANVQLRNLKSLSPASFFPKTTTIGWVTKVKIRFCTCSCKISHIKTRQSEIKEAFHTSIRWFSYLVINARNKLRYKCNHKRLENKRQGSFLIHQQLN